MFCVPAAPLIRPSERWGQTLCPIDAQTAILIGGQGAKMQFCKDPMWKLCMGGSTVNNIQKRLFVSEGRRRRFDVVLCPLEDMSWVAAETLAEGPTPEARIGHTAVYDPDSERIFVFGGSKNKKWFNDVHILDTRSWRWSMVEVCSDPTFSALESFRQVYQNVPSSYPGSGEGSPTGLPQLQHVSGGALRAGRGVSSPQPGARRLQRLVVHLRPSPLHLVPTHRHRGQTAPPIRVTTLH